jgi:tRNA (uracil-5-)-methyltransferase
MSEDGHPVVGFCLGRTADGAIMVSPPDTCTNVSSEMKAIAKNVESFLKTSPFTPYDQSNHVGCWRSMILRRSDRTGDSMVMITVTTSRLDAGQWEEEKERLIKEVGPLVSSLFIQIYDGVSTAPPDHPVLHLAGKDHIIEELFGLKVSNHITRAPFPHCLYLLHINIHKFFKL